MTQIAVREKPIPFSGPMVRAILDGKKTQTRRVVKPQPSIAPDLLPTRAEDMLPDGSSKKFCFTIERVPGVTRYLGGNQFAREFSPYGQPGERLWVRETWQLLHMYRDWATGQVDDWTAWEGKVPKVRPPGYVTAFAGEPGWGSDREERGFGWRPSIFMQRWASRLSLDITAVRVERVQDISEADAVAEGVYEAFADEREEAFSVAPPGESSFPTARQYYERLWDSLNAKRGHSWDSNPWVWVIEFARVPEAPSAA
jgi:hypothetical protein